MLLTHKNIVRRCLLFLSLLFTLAILPEIFIVEAKNYYLDVNFIGDSTLNGRDSVHRGGNGPWNKIGRINNFNSPTGFRPGDTIFIKRNTTVYGELWPKGSGSLSGQITLDAYGKGVAPVIDAQGAANKAAIKLEDQEYWTIQNLECRNYPVAPPSMARRWGIFVHAGNNHTVHKISIKNNIVRKIYGSYARQGTTSFYEVGGIYVRVSADSTMNTVPLDSLLIEGNQLFDIIGEGIFLAGISFDKNGNMNENILSKNVVIRGNSVYRTAGDGIVVMGTNNELIEYNLVDSAGQLGKGSPDTLNKVTGEYDCDGRSCTCVLAGIWPVQHKNGLIQHNEVCHTKMWWGDGAAFDNDLYLRGTTIFQYNYSHENEGGFFMESPRKNGDDPNAKSIVRYNISQNDGLLNNKYPGCFQFGRGNAQVYNNVFYTSGEFRFLFTKNNIFLNNVFCGKTASWNGNFFDYNCYAGGLMPPKDSKGKDLDQHKLITDPLFVGPLGEGGSGLGSVQCYKLQANSPCIGAGINIIGNGGHDFWGNHCCADQRRPSIGAYEKPE